MKNAIKPINKNSIFYKSLRKFTLIIIIPFLILSCIFGIYYYGNFKNNYEKLFYDRFRETEEKFKNVFESTEHIFNLMLASENPASVINSSDGTPAATDAAVKRLRNTLSIYSSLSGDILGITIYNFKTGDFFSTNEPSQLPELPNSKYTSASTGYIVKTSDITSNSPSFGICYNIYSPDGNNCIVTFIINPQIFGNESDDTPSYTYIYEKNGNVIFSSEVGSDFFYRDATPQKISRNGSIMYLSYEYNDFCIQSASRYNLYDMARPIFFAVIACLLISILTAFVLSLIISSDSYNLIHNIAVTVSDITNSDDNSDKYPNEVYYITDNIINLNAQNKNLEKELITQLHELKKLQNAVLQVQFSPHFLFNTLNCINLIAFRELGSGNSISHATLLLSELLTNAIDTSKYLIPIRDEIEYAKKYIEIEAIKNNNSFNTEWHIDQSITSCLTLKFVLQPIIENAFKHGIKYLPPGTPGKIIISVKKNDNKIIMSVQNNGPKIADDELKKLNESLENTELSMSGKHIGLANLNSRIKIVFGNKYSCRISSNEKNTTTEISIPYLK